MTVSEFAKLAFTEHVLCVGDKLWTYVTSFKYEATSGGVRTIVIPTSSAQGHSGLGVFESEILAATLPKGERWFP